MSQDLSKAARCYGLYVHDVSNTISVEHLPLSPMSSEIRRIGGYVRSTPNPVRIPEGTSRIASMCGVLYRPHPKVTDIMGFTRMVTLPDFQGLGLAMCLAGTVASAYKAMGKRLHSYPNHPAWIRSYQRSKNWIQIKESGEFSPRRGKSSTVGRFGGRRCAVYQYVGPSMNKEEAEKLIKGEDNDL